MLRRGPYGIEYTTIPQESGSRGSGVIVVLVALVALISLIWSCVRRSADAPEDEVIIIADEAVENALPADEVMDTAAKTPIVRSSLAKRPVKVRNLLMRLEEAEKAKDVEMAVTTIEQLRALPGSPVADLDDALARRLGALNLRRLFTLRNPQWVKEIVVKGGDSASRIAVENGASFASLAKLNNCNLEHIRAGQHLYVMDHPRFQLVFHRRTRTADLSLNGKFFRRYDLTAAPLGKEGAYQLAGGVRKFFKVLGVEMKNADLVELETLLPVGAPILIAEL